MHWHYTYALDMPLSSPQRGGLNTKRSMRNKGNLQHLFILLLTILILLINQSENGQLIKAGLLEWFNAHNRSNQQIRTSNLLKKTRKQTSTSRQSPQRNKLAEHGLKLSVLNMVLYMVNIQYNSYQSRLSMYQPMNRLMKLGKITLLMFANLQFSQKNCLINV